SRVEPNPEIVDPQQIVSDAIRLLRAAVPRSVSIQTYFRKDLPTVQADAAQIQQVILNLGINAWQAMDSGKGTISLELDEATLDSKVGQLDLAPGHYVCLVFRDDGRGMNEATLTRIFEPFFTTKTSDGGTGLGLSVVHNIIREHNGAIEARST